MASINIRSVRTNIDSTQCFNKCREAAIARVQILDTVISRDEVSLCFSCLEFATASALKFI